MEAKIRIISGFSYFVPDNQVIGVAFPYEGDPDGVRRWADKVGKSGRPATILPVNGGDPKQKVAEIRRRWTEWAEKEGIDLTIDDKVRYTFRRF